MNNFSSQLIDMYQQRMGYKQLKQVASDFGWSKQFLSNVRSGRSSLPEPVALKMAQACEIPDWEVVAKLAEERAKTPEERSAWQHALKRLSKAAAVFVLLASALLGSPNGEEPSFSHA